MIKRGTLSGGPFAEDETYLTFDWFLQGEKIVTEYAVRHSLQEAVKHNEARRLALKEERMDDY